MAERVIYFTIVGVFWGRHTLPSRPSLNWSEDLTVVGGKVCKKNPREIAQATDMAINFQVWYRRPENRYKFDQMCFTVENLRKLFIMGTWYKNVQYRCQMRHFAARIVHINQKAWYWVNKLNSNWISTPKKLSKLPIQLNSMLNKFNNFKRLFIWTQQKKPFRRLETANK